MLSWLGISTIPGVVANIGEDDNHMQCSMEAESGNEPSVMQCGEIVSRDSGTLAGVTAPKYKAGATCRKNPFLSCISVCCVVSRPVQSPARSHRRGT